MFLFAGIVGGIKGLFWSPAHVMRALAACLQVLQTPPAETAPAPGANSVSQSGRIKADLGHHSPSGAALILGVGVWAYNPSPIQMCQAGRVGGAEIQSTSWCQVVAPDAGLSAKGVPGANSLKDALRTHSSLPICPVGSGTLLFYPCLGVPASSVQFQTLWRVTCAALKLAPHSHHWLAPAWDHLPPALGTVKVLPPVRVPALLQSLLVLSSLCFWTNVDDVSTMMVSCRYHLCPKMPLCSASSSFPPP